MEKCARIWPRQGGAKIPKVAHAWTNVCTEIRPTAKRRVFIGIILVRCMNVRPRRTTEQQACPHLAAQALSINKHPGLKTKEEKRRRKRCNLHKSDPQPEGQRRNQIAGWIGPGSENRLNRPRHSPAKITMGSLKKFWKTNNKRKLRPYPALRPNTEKADLS